jgi:outer membrane lipoprotein SlyB
MHHPTPLFAWLLAGGILFGTAPAFASGGFQQVDTNAVLGGAIGGGAGAAVGSAIGGRNGAILGSAVGAGAGVMIATPQQRSRGEYREYDDRHDNGWHRGHHKHHHHEHDD